VVPVPGPSGSQFFYFDHWDGYAPGQRTITVILSQDVTLRAHYAGRVYETEPGWPQATDGASGSATVADLDGDGLLEVVVAASHSAYAWRCDGSLMAGWPQPTGGWNNCTPPAVGDVDGDGVLEIVKGSGDGFVYAWHADGGAAAGWPVYAGADAGLEYICSSPALGDLDGDGIPEVMQATNGWLYAWQADGSAADGWPQPVDSGNHSSPAIGDLDGDGLPEVVIGAGTDGNINVFRHDGSFMPGWPRHWERSTSPSLADIDRDGNLEVVMASCGGDHSSVGVWRSDGTLVSGWPVSTTTDASFLWGMGLADLDGDGALEIVASTGCIQGGRRDGRVWAWKADGSLLPGWPVPTGIHSSPPDIGDIDGDGRLEIIVSSGFDCVLYAWHSDGNLVDGFPLPVGERGFPSPVLADIDNDGLCEVVVGGSSEVTIWQMPSQHDAACSRANLPWPTFKHDPARSGAECTFDDVPTTSWAWRDVEAAHRAGVTKGYAANNVQYLYRPGYSARRDEMGAFVARALAGSDAAIPDPPATASFSDVPTTHWAYRYIEYAVSQNVVKGYGDGTYQPGLTIDRAQMAVYIARAMVAPGGDAAIPDPVPPATFSDVATTFWAYKQVEYCVGQGVVKGYDDGLYHPERVVTRDQMAVYIARAFGLL
jgi:hypothetical protein